ARLLIWRGELLRACTWRRRAPPSSRICLGVHYKQMAALEFGERVPMPIEQARENFRFHLAFLELFIALFVARIILTIRIHCRHEDDVLSIRRPNRAVGAG